MLAAFYGRQITPCKNGTQAFGKIKGDETAKPALSVAEGTPRTPSTRQENRGLEGTKGPEYYGMTTTLPCM